MSTLIDYAEVAKLGVATIYEASGKEGLIDLEFHQLIPGSRVAGPARTVRCAQDDNLMVHASIERIQKGEIVVLTMPEPRAVALIGDLLVTQIIQAGAAGVLVDASVRDAEDLATMGLPIWARWIRVRGAAKTAVGELDVPVTVGGATIAPGDTVVLDTDGACVIAQARFDAVLTASRKRSETEATNRVRYQRGERSYDINNLRQVVLAASK
jgi:4-hydroxy-4-methyl-2-oxoglutarate aldolase